MDILISNIYCFDNFMLFADRFSTYIGTCITSFFLSPRKMRCFCLLSLGPMPNVTLAREHCRGSIPSGKEPTRLRFPTTALLPSELESEQSAHGYLLWSAEPTPHRENLEDGWILVYGTDWAKPHPAAVPGHRD